MFLKSCSKLKQEIRSTSIQQNSLYYFKTQTMSQGKIWHLGQCFVCGVDSWANHLPETWHVKSLWWVHPVLFCFVLLVLFKKERDGSPFDVDQETSSEHARHCICSSQTASIMDVLFTGCDVNRGRWEDQKAFIQVPDLAIDLHSDEGRLCD